MQASARIVNVRPDSSRRSPLLVLVVGFVAAFGAGKLPPILPALQTELAIPLVQASLLIAMFQFAGAITGVFAGALADRVGHRSFMVIGLSVLAMGSLVGVAAPDSQGLLISRAIESLGFVMAVLPGPVLLRRVVSSDSLSRWLGSWATYMPFGFAIGLVVSPWLTNYSGWRAVWLLHCVIAVVVAIAVWRALPADDSPAGKRSELFLTALRQTLTASGPWMLAIAFAAYAGQYLAVIGFLPSIYQQGGITASTAGLLTALAAGINVIGNFSAGYLIHRGIRAPLIIAFASVVMLIGAWFVFAAPISFSGRYLAVLIFSATMGLVPGTLFVLAERYAPSPGTVSTTVGLMQQGSALGQLLVPVLVALAASMSAGWTNTWLVTGVFALCNLALALMMLLYERGRSRR